MKRALVTAVQAAVSAGLIWWIFRDPGQRAAMAEALRAADLRWFVPGLAAFGAALALQTQRWFVLLRALGIPMGWGRCVQLLMVGQFFNLFLLGSTGGDFVKMFYAMRECPAAKAGAFLSVVVDRVVGMVALAAISVLAAAYLLGLEEFRQTPTAQALLVTLGLIMAGVLGMVAVAAVVSAFGIQERLPAKLPLRQAVVDLAVATARYSRSPGALAQAFAVSVGAHFALFSTFYFAAKAFSAPLGLVQTFSVMPIINTITSLPISLAGVGVREKLFTELLSGLFAVPFAQAVLISLGGYLIMVAWSLGGGLVYLAYRPPGGAASLREIQAADAEIARHPETGR